MHLIYKKKLMRYLRFPEFTFKVLFEILSIPFF